MTTYYIKNGGSDIADGLSDDNAWATIAKVNSITLNPDDFVYFKCGSVWYEALSMNTSGASGHPITFGNYGAGAKPLIVGAEVLNPASWSLVEGSVYSQSLFVCTWLFEDGYSLPHASSSACDDGNWYHNGTTLYYKASDGSNPTLNGKSVWRTGTNTFFQGSVKFGVIPATNYITFDNIQFKADAFNLYAPATGKTFNGIKIQNCDFSDCPNGLLLTAGGGNCSVDVTDCTFIRCANNIFFGIGDNNLNTVNVLRNTLTDCGRTWETQYTGDYTALGGDSGGIYLQNLANSLIKQNRVLGGTCETDGGISHWINTANATNNTITRNYIRDLQGPGIGNGGEGSLVSTIEISFNIVVRCGSGPTKPYGGLRVSKYQDNSKIVNNAVVECDIGLYMLGQADDYAIKNNIFYNNTKAVRSDSVDPDNGTILDYNCYYPDNSTAFGYGDGDDRNFASFHSLYPTWDVNSILTDPLFVNTSGDFSEDTDFRLSSNSPCKNAGVDVGLVEDYEGKAVPL